MILNASKLTRLDPTRTTTLRRQFERGIRKRVRAVQQGIRELVVDEDVFGLKSRSPLVLHQLREAWRFRTGTQKIEAFRSWLQEQTDANILEVDGTGAPWTKQYIDSAYRRGVVNAYSQTRKEALADNPDFYQGTREEFLRSSFNQPETLQKLQFIYARTFNDLKGFTDQMAQQTSRELAAGLAQGWNPVKVARQMNKRIASLTKTRALVIARTEVIAAHAEGQLDSYERLGQNKLTVMAEWSTAGDDLVCPLCLPLEGVVMTVKEARGILPRHPNCRCSWIPANVGESGKGQKTGVERRRAIKRSLRAERPNSSLPEARRRSVWAGKE